MALIYHDDYTYASARGIVLLLRAKISEHDSTGLFSDYGILVQIFTQYSVDWPVGRALLAADPEAPLWPAHFQEYKSKAPRLPIGALTTGY
jgi:hypothetical protein